MSISILVSIPKYQFREEYDVNRFDVLEEFITQDIVERLDSEVDEDEVSDTVIAYLDDGEYEVLSDELEDIGEYSLVKQADFDDLVAFDNFMEYTYIPLDIIEYVLSGSGLAGSLLSAIDYLEECSWIEASAYEDLALEVVEQTGLLDDIPDRIANYFDYEQYGRDLVYSGNYMDTEQGYFISR